MTREEAKNSLRIGNEYLIMDAVFNDHEAQLKTKDEEIEKIKQQKRCLSLDKTIMIDRWLREKHKARSIVAMLFWKWRKSIRESGDNTFYNDEFDDGNYWFVNAKEQSFKQAYKMLKDNK